MSNNKLHIKKGDQVVVISGNEKGKSGKVLSVLIKKNRVVVEGVNVATKHSKPSAANPDGGIVKVEAPIHASNLKLMDAKGQAASVKASSKAKKSTAAKKSKKTEEETK